MRHDLLQALDRPPVRAEWAAAVGGFGKGESVELERFDEQLRIMVSSPRPLLHCALPEG